MNGKKRTTKPTRVTMTDVAKLAGVSQTTVSFVVNDLDAGLPERTKLKVLQACATLNYSPNDAARRLASKTSRSIGLAVYDIEAITSYRRAAASVIAAIYRTADAKKQRLQICTKNASDKENTYQNAYFIPPVRSREVDGMIVWDPIIDESFIVSAFNDGLSIVTLDRQCGKVPCVIPDYDYGFRQIAEHLVKMNYNHICIAGRDNGHCYRDRRAKEAFITAAKDIGIPIEDMTSLVVNTETHTSPERMADLIDEMLSKKPWPRVIVCMYDAIALATLAALKDKGISVPEDIAVIGCAGIPATADPAYDLTTLDVKYNIMGQHAVDMILRMTKDEDISGTSIVVQPELIVRSSA